MWKAKKETIRTSTSSTKSMSNTSMMMQNTLKGSQLESIAWAPCSWIFICFPPPDEENERHWEKDAVGFLLFSTNCLILKAPCSQEFVDFEVNETDENKGQDVVNQTGKDCEPQINSKFYWKNRNISVPDPILLGELCFSITPVLEWILGVASECLIQYLHTERDRLQVVFIWLIFCCQFSSDLLNIQNL